jgi:oxygen-independent coproporphyrinogen-3 oxidase
MGLRTTEGIPIERLRHLGGERLFNNINYLIESGFLQQSDDMLRTTTTGRPVLNSILREILAD